jgi:hypothetical protein
MLLSRYIQLLLVIVGERRVEVRGQRAERVEGVEGGDIR